MPEAAPPTPKPEGADEELTRRQRAAAIMVGCLTAFGGVAAVFLSDNQAGTAALFAIAAIFLACGVFRLRPTKFSIKDGSVEFVGRAAIATVERLATDADPEVRAKTVEAFDDELSNRGLVRPGSELADSVIRSFVRAGLPQSIDIADHLRSTGWQPESPPKSRYVRWTYAGGTGPGVSLTKTLPTSPSTERR